MKRTEQKNRVETRKHKALRRTLACLFLLAALAGLRLYAFTPMQSVRQVEEKMGTGQTRVVRRMSGEKWNEWDYLTANDNAILLSKVSFHPLVGWNGGAMSVLDCDGLGDFQARAMTWRIGGEQFTRVMVYGRTKSPEAQGIRVEGHWNETDERTRNLPEVKLSGGPELWTDKDGWRYFYMEKRIPDTRNGEMAYPEWMTADLLDGAGNTLGRYK